MKKKKQMGVPDETIESSSIKKKRQRAVVLDEIIQASLQRLKEKMEYRLKEKGHGTLASIHEISGILREEVTELDDAIHKNNYQHIREELLDIAVGAVFGEACIAAKTIDW